MIFSGMKKAPRATSVAAAGCSLILTWIVQPAAGISRRFFNDATKARWGAGVYAYALRQKPPRNRARAIR
jgi:hypothetical protein